jgi:hypothetical protein
MTLFSRTAAEPEVAEPEVADNRTGRGPAELRWGFAACSVGRMVVTNIEELKDYVARLHDLLYYPQPGLERWRTALDDLLLKIVEFAPAPVEYADLVALTTELVGLLSAGNFEGEEARQFAGRLDTAVARLTRSRLPWATLAEEGWLIAAMNHYRRDGRRWLFVVMTKDFQKPGRTRLLSIRHEGLDDSQFWNRMVSLARHEEEFAEMDARRANFFGMEKSFGRE